VSKCAEIIRKKITFQNLANIKKKKRTCNREGIPFLKGKKFVKPSKEETIDHTTHV
jgi:hypothetical protein